MLSIPFSSLNQRLLEIIITRCRCCCTIVSPLALNMTRAFGCTFTPEVAMVGCYGCLMDRRLSCLSRQTLSYTMKGAIIRAVISE